jgi:HEAT repeat protein
MDDNKQIREAAAELLSKIDGRLDESKHFDEKIELSRKLTQWLKYESEISPVYERIANQLQQTAQHMLRNEKFDEAHEIIDAYHRIYTGSLSKDDAITALSENMLQNISTEDILDILLKDSSTDEISRQKKDIHSLIIMGTTTVERLLDRLHDSHNRAERRRIIEVITKIGNPAITPVVERLRQEGPWFYLRNLVLLLGRIGSDTHLKLLESILMHEDLRVQREAVFAIQAIDAGKTGEIILRNIYTVGQENFGLMISVLGLLKYQGAVSTLIEMLESGSPVSRKKDKNEVMIKICEALGKIGNEEAIRPLKNVMRTKGFLSIRSVDPEIRDAAKEAIERIKKKIE